MGESEIEFLRAVADELRRMRVRASVAESMAHCNITEACLGETTSEDRLHYEWLLGRFSGISEALAYVEDVINLACVDKV